jgi:hypothetical protein
VPRLFNPEVPALNRRGLDASSGPVVARAAVAAKQQL